MTGVLAWIGVAAFGAVGAWARFSVGAVIAARRPTAFPLGTFVVNLTGGFLLGLLTGLAVTGEPLLVFGTGPARRLYDVLDVDGRDAAPRRGQ